MKAIEIYNFRGKTLFHLPAWYWLIRLLEADWFFPNARWGFTTCYVRFRPSLWVRE